MPSLDLREHYNFIPVDVELCRFPLITKLNWDDLGGTLLVSSNNKQHHRHASQLHYSKVHSAYTSSHGNNAKTNCLQSTLDHHENRHHLGGIDS